MSAIQQINQFAQDLKIVPCVKTSVPELIGFYGDSGGGKTVTALIALVGMCGPKAKIGVVDTENRRAGVAADIVRAMAQEHFKEAPEIVCINLEPPFNPLRYVAALGTLRGAGCQGFLVDSMSHAWQGEGGYLDLKEAALDRMAGNDWSKREKCALAAAAQVKPATHAVLVRSVLQLKSPTVLCFRAKERTTITRVEGKTKVETDPYSSPIQEAGMIYEMLVSGEVSARDGIGGYCSFRGVGRKTTHPAILKLLPKEGEQFGFGHGQALAAWFAEPASRPAQATGSPPAVAPSSVGPAALPAVAPAAPAASPVSSQGEAPKAAQAPGSAQGAPLPLSPEIKKLRAELWRLTKGFRPAGETNWESTIAWLVMKGFVETANLDTFRAMTEGQLHAVIQAVQSHLVNPR